jgi:flagellar protein FlaF
MIEASLATSGYKSSAQSISSDRGLEYQVFSQVTRDLAAARVGAHDYHSKIASALSKNMKLWSFLASEVSDASNALPPQLRASIFYLAEFTRTQTAKVYAGEATPNILVEINTMVMRGLRGQEKSEGSG